MEDVPFTIEELLPDEPTFALCTGTNCCFASTEMEDELLDGLTPVSAIPV